MHCQKNMLISRIDVSQICLIGLTLNILVNFGMTFYQIVLNRTLLLSPLVFWIIPCARDSWFGFVKFADHMTILYMVKMFSCFFIVVLNSAILIKILSKGKQQSKRQ